jgi:aryl-alcohol dehydrogenase-like predicted oxidoreductase
LQYEYSLWSRDPEEDVLPLARELGIGFVAYSPLGRGALTGTISSTASLEDGDFRRLNPRFQEQNLAANLERVARVSELAAEKGATPAQIALAWLLAQGADVVPIPGTKRVRYLEQNVAAGELLLEPDDLQRLDEVFPVGAAAGDRYADMTRVNIDAPPAAR